MRIKLPWPRKCLLTGVLGDWVDRRDLQIFCKSFEYLHAPFAGGPTRPAGGPAGGPKMGNVISLRSRV